MEKMTLSQSIESFMRSSKPQERSIKYRTIQNYSSKNLLECDDFEVDRYMTNLDKISITISDSIRYTSGNQRPLGDLVRLLHDSNNSNIDKLSRKVLYNTSDGSRPVSDSAYVLWNGFQVIDMDIKDGEMAQSLKSVIFEKLNKLPWFLGVALSSSGQGLHVYTKIQVPESLTYEQRVKMFRINFRHKYSCVYMACLRKCDKKMLQEWMDISMFRPQQGAFIGFDREALLSTGFFEDFLYVEFDRDAEWFTHKDLKVIFERWEFFDDLEPSEVDVVSKDVVDLKGKVHYKHQQRWRLANTLVHLYGQDQGYKYLRAICSDKIKDEELKAICSTAARHKKGADEGSIGLLNTKHGFDIKTKADKSELIEITDGIDNPNQIFKPQSTVEYHINENQYLGHISTDLELEFQSKWISILEAGPGLGKTEFVKSLAKTKKVLLVMPFTSTIQSKTEQDSHFKVSYGNKPVNLNWSHGMATTIDKFSRLDPLDVNMAGYDYIFIDESHLMFVSGYRDVMSNALNLINQLQVPIILMTGTPTGEFLFFKEAHHVKVNKTDLRQKQLDIMVVQDSPSIVPQICKAILQDIKDGNRVLFPTNQGTQFAKSIEAGLRLLCDKELIEVPKIAYYKRSNMGDSFMDVINQQATIEDIDILLCTSFLSVGVDILDKYNFRIYFSELCLPAECDQWCNRLRNNDLIARLYVALYDSAGNPNNITKYQPVDFNESDEETNMAIDMVNMCNEYLARESLVHHYNNIIQRVLSDNRYVRYDSVENKYKIDPLAFMLTIYENRLRDYCTQLPVFMKGMQCYGYDLNVVETESLENLQIELKNYISGLVSEYRSYKTQVIEDMLYSLTPEHIEVFTEVLKNKMDLRKGDFKITDDILYVPDIEVFNKISPHIVSLYRRYDIQEILSIFEFVRGDKTSYNMAELGRLRSLFSILDSQEARLLDIQFEKFMNESYDFAESGQTVQEVYNQFFVDFIVGNHQLSSPKSLEKLQDIYERVFRCLVNVKKSKKGIKMSRREVFWQTRNEKTMALGDFILNDFISQYIEILER